MNIRSRLISTAAVSLLVLFAVAACGGSETPQGTVVGTVTLGEGDAAEAVTVGGAAAPSTAASAPAAAGDAAAGKAVFSANCGACHTLADAGAAGTVGPDLDQSKPDAALVADRVANGKGAMPPFAGQLSDADIANVAAYVSSVAGG